MKEVKRATNLPTCLIDLINEYCIPDGECTKCNDHAIAKLNMDEDLHHPFKIFCRQHDHDSEIVTINQFEYAYCGTYNSVVDFAREHILENTESIADLPWYIFNAIDWMCVWNNISVDYWEEDSHMFKVCY